MFLNDVGLFSAYSHNEGSFMRLKKKEDNSFFFNDKTTKQILAIV